MHVILKIIEQNSKAENVRRVIRLSTPENITTDLHSNKVRAKND